MLLTKSAKSGHNTKKDTDETLLRTVNPNYEISSVNKDYDEEEGGNETEQETKFYI